MDDLISRKEAINAHCELCPDKKVCNCDICPDVELFRLIHSVPRWIPVTERMPVEYTRVIGYMAWKAMTAIEYQHGRWYSIDHLEPLPDEAVSHWMPLPQPPKEGDE